MVSSLIDSSIYDFLLNEINLLCPSRRRPKYPLSHYFDILLFILKTGCSFRDSCFFLSVPKNHFTTVFKKFSSWSSQGIFNIIHDKLLESYSRTYFNNLKYLDVFIDSSNIRNKNGHDLISYGFKDRGKKGNNISFIVDENKVPLMVEMDASKVHDARIMEVMIDRMNEMKCLPEKINLVGDKGYIKKKRIHRREKEICLVVPYKKNQNKDNTNEEKSLLKKRHRIENTFSRLKQFKKVSTRYEQSWYKYYNFLMMATIILTKETMIKLELRHKKI